MSVSILKSLMLGLFVIPAFSFAEITFPTEASIPDDLSLYIQPTVSGNWRSGTFGMVRNSGKRFHEGWDIKPFKRDSNGKVSDKVFSVLKGRVVHVCNVNNGSYGKYVVLEHSNSDVCFYSLYAHLDSVSPDIEEGLFVSAGTLLGIMGNTSSVYKIPKGLEHLHFEVGFRLGGKSFQDWYEKTFDKSDKNLHSFWNGLNLSGFDPALFFQEKSPDIKRILDEIPTAFSVVVYSGKTPDILEYSPGLLTEPAGQGRKVNFWKVEFSWSGLPKSFTPIYGNAKDKPVKIKIENVYNKYIQNLIKRGMIISSGKTFIPGKNLINTLEIIFGESL